MRSIHSAIADNEGSSYVRRSNEQYGDSNWRDTLPDGGSDHLSAVGGDAFLLTATPTPEVRRKASLGDVLSEYRATKKGLPFGGPF
ncbi:hypothetical protein [Pseudomonas orientalis]|uniref:hypothetical protein n=1 Tax=Pseudomonas orientalis TaxID=76758 RepID=UPI0013DE60AA|nr:hypothetical protein [Pseudomonas orientalis]